MLRPRDIKNHKFRSSFKGYRKDEVDKFLKEVYLDYQELYVENLSLMEENGDLKIKVEDYEAQAKYLDEAKKMANKVMDATNKCVKNKYAEAQNAVIKMLDKAKKDADSIIDGAYYDSKTIIRNAEKEAFEKADVILNAAKQEAERINAANDELIKKYMRMKKRIMMLIEAEAKIMSESDKYVFEKDEE